MHIYLRVFHGCHCDLRPFLATLAQSVVDAWTFTSALSKVAPVQDAVNADVVSKEDNQTPTQVADCDGVSGQKIRTNWNKKPAVNMRYNIKLKLKLTAVKYKTKCEVNFKFSDNTS